MILDDRLRAFDSIDAQLMTPVPILQPSKLFIDQSLCNILPWMTPFKGMTFNFSVLRADLNHQHISGNKWYKLRYWLSDYLNKQNQCSYPLPLHSYGGAHSNHLVALASAAQAMDLEFTSFVRSNHLHDQLIETPTIQRLYCLGAKVKGISRSEYRQVRSEPQGYISSLQRQQNAYYRIPEGGQGIFGVLGVEDWVKSFKTLFKDFDAVITGVGTGMTFVGFLMALSAYSIECLGVPVVRSRPWLGYSVQKLLSSRGLNSQTNQHSVQWRLDSVFSQKGVVPADQKLVQHLADQVGFPVDPLYMPRVLQAMVWHYGRIYTSKPINIVLIHNGGLQARGSAMPSA